ncbi:MAG TPA: tetratricopeptide repeat protein [Pyrinomonadaceae bacterium]|nr:tetratricopeptide repeat protein [Pyrinomonadaceae bacterium]
MITIVVGLVGLVAGFLLANTLNRNELSTLRADNERLKTNQASGSQAGLSGTLSEDELAATIAQADRKPDDFQTQRNVGVAIYRYGATKQDAQVIKRSIAILDRAIALRPDDYDVVLSLANANFDVGYFEKDNASLVKARTLYENALKAKPDDPNVRTDLGLTYFLQTPPDLEGSVNEFKKALEKNARHEKTLQFLVQALAKQNKMSEAADYLQQLRAVNPQNESIAELQSMVSTSQPAG